MLVAGNTSADQCGTYKLNVSLGVVVACLHHVSADHLRELLNVSKLDKRVLL
jgi:hypothetical protein